MFIVMYYLWTNRLASDNNEEHKGSSEYSIDKTFIDIPRAFIFVVPCIVILG